MRSKILTAPNADARELALILIVIFLPAATWLSCGAIVAWGKRMISRIVRKESSVKVTPKPGGQAQAAMNFLFHLIFEIVTVVMDTVLGVIRTALSYMSLIFLLIFALGASYIMLHYNVELIKTVDSFYETLRPNIIEMLLQVMNFTRVIFAMFIAFWNAFLQILLIPVRLIFDAGYQCGGITLMQNIANTLATVVQESAKSTTDFFTLWGAENRMDLNITAVSKSVRGFVIIFVEVIECSCHHLDNLTHVVAHPLWNDKTDLVVNAGARTLIKAIEVPWMFLTVGETSWEPVFQQMLDETDGLLVTGAAVLNEHLTKAVDWIQIGAEFQFQAPPYFSVQHRILACNVLEPLRTGVKLAAVIPSLMRGIDLDYANLVREKASLHGARLQCEKFWTVVAVDCFAKLNNFFRPLGEWFAATQHVRLHSMELSYNSTMTAAFGIGELDWENGGKKIRTM
jgi:hypothetical protein